MRIIALMPFGIVMEATTQSCAVAIHATLLEIEKVTEEFKMWKESYMKNKQNIW